MNLKKLLTLIGATLMGAGSLTGCSLSPAPAGAEAGRGTAEVKQVEKAKEKDRAFVGAPARPEAAAVIYLAGGCFWGTEAYFAKLPGVTATEVGYANGRSEETSYHELKVTGHAETVKVSYDPAVISLAELLDRYYIAIDPLSLNRQGNDSGTQYRTGIYYTDDFSRRTAELSLELLHERLGQKSYIELEPLRNYVRAEEYHQDYLVKEPYGYCHLDLGLAERPLFPLPEKMSEEEAAAKLSPELRQVAFAAGTERAFSSPLDQEFRPGVYLDAVTGQVLFSSRDKYDSGSGWPAFTRGITTDALRYDYSLAAAGGAEAEVRNANGQVHLGHVFDRSASGGPARHYCINGISLRFVPAEQMREAGLAQYLPYLLKPEA